MFSKATRAAFWAAMTMLNLFFTLNWVSKGDAGWAAFGGFGVMGGLNLTFDALGE